MLARNSVSARLRLLGELRLEVAEHVQLRVVGVGDVEVVVVVAAPEERLAAGDVLDVVGVARRGSRSTSYSASPKSSPTGPTTRTSVKKLAASEKCTAEPPSMRSRSPNGVRTASKAIDPTTTRLMGADSLDRRCEDPSPWPPSLLAFASSVAWGAADFLGGLKSRRLPLLNVLRRLAGAPACVLIGAFVAIRGEGAAGRRLRACSRRSRAWPAWSGWPPSTAASRSATWAWSRRSRPAAAVVPVVVGIATGRPARRRSSRPGSRWRWSASCSPRARRSAGAAARGPRAARAWRWSRRSASASSSSAMDRASDARRRLGDARSTASPASRCCWPRSACCARRWRATRADLPVLASRRHARHRRERAVRGRRDGGPGEPRVRARLALSAHDRGAGGGRAGRAPAPRSRRSASCWRSRGRGADRRRLSASAPRLPSVAMSLPWAEPFAAALALRHEPGLVLLESMPGFGELGRRSFLAARPAEVATDGLRAPRRGSATAGGPAGSRMTWARDRARCPSLARDDLGLPPLALGRYEAWLEFDHARRRGRPSAATATRAHLVRALARAPAHAPRRLHHAGRRRGRARCRAPTTSAPCARAIDYIRAGDVFQVNLSQRLATDWERRPVRALRAPAARRARRRSWRSSGSAART